MSGNIIIYVKMEIAFEYTIHKDMYFLIIQCRCKAERLLSAILICYTIIRRKYYPELVTIMEKQLMLLLSNVV